ncbi:MAG: DUF5606 domain-containing protein [Deltaproteobacteria bacterium]
MNIDKFVAVSGFPGLFKLINTRSNGILISDPDTGKTRFVSVRQHQFTPLATVGIYTFDDTVELAKVFKSIQEQLNENPIVDIKSNSDEIRNYFTKILPEHDPERVHISDIKKIIKWYEYLNTRGFLNEADSEEE